MRTKKYPINLGLIIIVFFSLLIIAACSFLPMAAAEEGMLKVGNWIGHILANIYFILMFPFGLLLSIYMQSLFGHFLGLFFDLILWSILLERIITILKIKWKKSKLTGKHF